MNKVLYTSYYTDKSPIRQNELDLCLQMNIANDEISKIHLFVEKGCVGFTFPVEHNEKIVVLNTERPTYKDFFSYINKVSSQKDISIISNTDIFFDETIKLLDGFDFENTCLALSRWHFNHDDTIRLHNEKWSQDTWVFQGKIKPVQFCDFYLGIRGCDNRIAYELKKAGYTVLNPSKSIRSIHYHLSDLHNYDNKVIPKPYLSIEPTELQKF